jgi:predicted DNA-binding transcriptional regulator YafY
MANTSSRTLRLLSLLQSHRFWPGEELADRLEVSVRTLRRDIDRLRDLGYPVRASRGVDGGYQLAAGAALPPLVVDHEEAVALAVALLQAAQTSAVGTADASLRALAKVVQVMPEPLRHKVDAVRAATEQLPLPGAAMPVDTGALTTLAQACRDRERVRCGYTAADGAVTERLIEPHRLVPVARRWYLVAYDCDRGDWRSFRLDRMNDVRPAGARFAPRRLPAEDAAAFVHSRLALSAQRHEVVAEVRAPAEVVSASIGRWATVEPTGADGCRVTVHADNLDWAGMALAMTGHEFRVTGPQEAVAHIREWAGRFARAVTVSRT